MSDTDFWSFLQEQRDTLIGWERSVRLVQTNIVVIDHIGPPPPAGTNLPNLDKHTLTSLDDVTRRFADAYLVCSAEQRVAIRKLVSEFALAISYMAISPARIEFKFDDILFQRALIIESMKDLRPDSNAGMQRLRDLCSAARKAQIDVNVELRRIAKLSNHIRHDGKRSMRDVLLEFLLESDGNTVRCRQCFGQSLAVLPACPHCKAANPLHVTLHAPAIGQQGETGNRYSPIDLLFYIPTRDLLMIITFITMWTALVLLAVVQIIKLRAIADYHWTWQAWLRYVGIAILLGTLWHFQSIRQITKYVHVRGRLAFRWFQVLIIVPLGAAAAIILFLLIWDMTNSLRP